MDMDLAAKIRSLNISIVDETDCENIYNTELTALTQGPVLDGFDTFIGRFGNAIFSFAVSGVALSAIICFVIWVSPLMIPTWILSVLSVITAVSAILVLLTLLRLYYLPHKSAHGLNSGSITGGFLHDAGYRENIECPNALFAHAQMIRETYPELQVDVWSTSLYLLYPGLPIQTERDRTIRRVRVRGRDPSDVVTIGCWVQMC